MNGINCLQYLLVCFLQYLLVCFFLFNLFNSIHHLILVKLWFFCSYCGGIIHKLPVKITVNWRKYRNLLKWKKWQNKLVYFHIQLATNTNRACVNFCPYSLNDIMYCSYWNTEWILNESKYRGGVTRSTLAHRLIKPLLDHLVNDFRAYPFD